MFATSPCIVNQLNTDHWVFLKMLFLQMILSCIQGGGGVWSRQNDGMTVCNKTDQIGYYENLPSLNYL